jgi:predicted kinase
MPLFLSCRAAIRAKTSVTAARVQPDSTKAEELRRLARDYLAMAERLLDPEPPVLVAIGGFSGSGKSTLARALAASVGRPPGTLVVRSDEVRKRLCGVTPSSRLGPEGYSQTINERVYTVLAEQADIVIRTGQSAIVDAVYARPSDRLAIEQRAATLGVRFVGIWLDVPEAMLIERTEQRHDDLSDANGSVIRTQVAQGTGHLAWHRIEASMPPDAVERAAAARLRHRYGA